ncbi:aspartyl-tRNA(Asn)/glutamyl-tRNA(Gln) amidotransferase subunit A [Rhodobacter sp. JA431]|uniref:amidase n=1 Tax=Rhodobacter sp. JA431 TaxID=570013 RepID=UPI000BCA06D0|nr:amidase family protein [Rhodobacter sp. JA431]SOC17186.1 aspartyl-tRNA(Asn)/glutamyl-tRNA(Gln) amidotransferase subunit A [Rhodobacter sp. JA431]
MLERFWSAAAQGQAMAEGRLDPVELAESYLEAAEPRHDVYARLTADRARFEAMAARTRLLDGLGRSPLDGVALSWKDLFDSAGTVTEAGSLLLAGRVPNEDAEVLRQASLAGTVCLGKTHMTELAFSGLGLNPNTATPPNAVTRGLAPGGSSSGAAVSVKLGLAAAAVGSDTGGSVRIPAAWNDIVGLKTTHGRVSTRGVVPLCKRFDTVGPLARTVEDCALVLAALEGTKAPDLRGATLDGARLLVLDGLPFDSIREAPARGFESAVAKLARAGATVEHMALPMVSPAMDLSGILFAPEAYGLWHDTIEAAPEKMYPLILQRFRGGAQISAAVYVKGWDDLARHRAEFYAATAGYDAVLVPTAPILPPDALRLLTDAAYFETENLLALRNTRLANIFGLCALTLPTGEPMCGLSLMGKPMREEALLRLGMAVEAALG